MKRLETKPPKAVQLEAQRVVRQQQQEMTRIAKRRGDA